MTAIKVNKKPFTVTHLKCLPVDENEEENDLAGDYSTYERHIEFFVIILHC